MEGFTTQVTLNLAPRTTLIRGPRVILRPGKPRPVSLSDQVGVRVGWDGMGLERIVCR